MGTSTAEPRIRSRQWRGVIREYADRLDVTDAESVYALRADLQDEAVDVLVNNAGTAHYGAFATTPEADFDAVFAVHVKGVYFLTQALLPLLAAGVAFFALLSIAPVLVTALSIYGAVNTPEEAVQQLSGAAGVLPPEVQHVGVARGAAEHDARAGALEQQVGHRGRAVHHAGDAGGRRA